MSHFEPIGVLPKRSLTTEEFVLALPKIPCPLCATTAERGPSRGDSYNYECSQCGRFEITGTAAARDTSPEVQVKLAGWIRDENRNRVVPRVSSETLDRIARRPLPSVADRSERLLLEAIHGMERLDGMVSLAEPRFVTATYSRDSQEMSVLWRLLLRKGWIARVADQGPRVTITAEGYIAAEALATERGRSEEVFVAMSFSPEMASIYDDGLRLGIERAGYVPIRVDRTEHVNRIDDEILALIRRSAFVVAELTEQKLGVYFEAGFAMGLSLPVIWSCRKDDLGDLHFDVRQYNCIDWREPNELAIRLQNRIKAIFGPGPRMPPEWLTTLEAQFVCSISRSIREEANKKYKELGKDLPTEDDDARKRMVRGMLAQGYLREFREIHPSGYKDGRFHENLLREWLNELS